MQVIKKRRIVLASVLKPIDDTRLYEKIGVSLVNSREFEVIIIGFPSALSEGDPRIKFYSLRPFSRFSLARLTAPFKIFHQINQVKPDLVLINTPELLFISILQRIFYGRKIIYDVLENYYRNIRYADVFPTGIRQILSILVRTIELVSRPFVSLFILAEKGYVKELTFAKPSIIAENKLPRSLANGYSRSKSSSHYNLLFSGTLAPTTGVLEAIKLSKELHSIDSNYRLAIAGYCSLPSFYKTIIEEISGCSFITIKGGDTLVPHKEILEAISQSDVGIIIYPVNPSTQSSIPTKLYEYLTLNLLVLIQHNSEAQSLVLKHNAGIVLPTTVDPAHLHQQLRQFKRIDKVASPGDASIFWENEGKRIMTALKLL